MNNYLFLIHFNTLLIYLIYNYLILFFKLIKNAYIINADESGQVDILIKNGKLLKQKEKLLLRI